MTSNWARDNNIPNFLLIYRSFCYIIFIYQQQEIWIIFSFILILNIEMAMMFSCKQWTLCTLGRWVHIVFNVSISFYYFHFWMNFYNRFCFDYIQWNVVYSFLNISIFNWIIIDVFEINVVLPLDHQNKELNWILKFHIKEYELVDKKIENNKFIHFITPYSSKSHNIRK